MEVLNLKQSSEKVHVVPEVDPLAKGADDGGGTFMTRTSPSTGVADSIESYRDHNTNQASPGPHQRKHALGEWIPPQGNPRRVTVCNVKGAAVIAPGRGIVPGKPERLAKKRSNVRRAKGTTHTTTRGSRRVRPTPRGISA
jgi:hypothetical protein